MFMINTLVYKILTNKFIKFKDRKIECYVYRGNEGYSLGKVRRTPFTLKRREFTNRISRDYLIWQKWIDYFYDKKTSFNNKWQEKSLELPL